MTEAGFWMILGAATLIILVFLEGRRQARRYGPPSARPNLLGAGILEVQRHLQADRHVEVLQKRQKAEENEVYQQETPDSKHPDHSAPLRH